MEDKVKAYKLKGFSNEEISRLLKMDLKKVEEKLKDYKPDITNDSIDMYSEMQKDLSKLILTEMSKEKRDSAIILNAIKLQAELQEKKLLLGTKTIGTTISKSYIYDRDKEIYELSKTKNLEDIAKQFNISVLSVKQALDRFELNLSDELKTLSPSIISETIGLDKKTRLKMLEDAYKNKLTRKDIREIVIKIKNESR